MDSTGFYNNRDGGGSDDDGNPRPRKRVKQQPVGVAAVPEIFRPEPVTIREFIETNNALPGSFPTLTFLASHVWVDQVLLEMRSEQPPDATLFWTPPIPPRLCTMIRLHVPTDYELSMANHKNTRIILATGRGRSKYTLQWAAVGLPYPCPYTTVTWIYRFYSRGVITKTVSYVEREQDEPLLVYPCPTLEHRVTNEDGDKIAVKTDLILPPYHALGPEADVFYHLHGAKYSFLLARRARKLDDSERAPALAQEILDYTFQLRTAPNDYRRFSVIKQYVLLTFVQEEGVSDADVEYAIWWLYLYGHILISTLPMNQRSGFCIYLSTPHPSVNDRKGRGTSMQYYSLASRSLSHFMKAVIDAVVEELGATFAERPEGVSTKDICRHLPRYDQAAVYHALKVMESRGDVTRIRDDEWWWPPGGPL